MINSAAKSGTAAGMRDNFKKATVEMLILHLLSGKPMYVYEMIQALESRSDNHYRVTTLYPAIYRLLKFGYIREHGKKVSQDNRLRRFYAVTDTGMMYLDSLRSDYYRLSDGVRLILESRPN
ncbi:MAG: helix-turn-helix transcriptional regulator [Clostridiaceae bacterium]|jgi:PadR family transcriptional regulator PadR|nr:PadR family transcriptional regulator [Oscillospiraceae bacterium]NLO62043.1 helix-turn-helix transcriptional regulator [Clostridiaceae bacterium]